LDLQVAEQHDVDGMRAGRRVVAAALSARWKVWLSASNRLARNARAAPSWVAMSSVCWCMVGLCFSGWPVALVSVLGTGI
jgi:hypothetical protein